MSTPPTIVEVTRKVLERIQFVAPTLTPKIKRVFYGETALTPDFPSVLVESGPRTKTFRQTRQWTISYTVFATLLHGKLESAEIITAEEEGLVAALEESIESDLSLDGLVINGTGFVRSIEPVGLVRGNARYRGTRLRWQGDALGRF